MASLAALMLLVRSLAWVKKVDVAPLEHSERVEVAFEDVFSCALFAVHMSCACDAHDTCVAHVAVTLPKG